MRTDEELLRLYANEKSEEAFAELVDRRCNLVWSAAHRVLGDADLARDAAQRTFTDLARKAGRLSSRSTLAGWLYRAAYLHAVKMARTESRRTQREQDAMSIQELSRDDAAEAKAVAELQPLLDAALGDLPEADRDAIVLRFLCGQSFAQVGAALGVNDDTAQKRVARAVEKLRESFRRRGVQVTGGTVGAALGAAGSQAAPIGVAAALSHAALAATAAGTAFPLIAIMKIKTITSIAITIATGSALVWQHHALSRAEAENAALREQSAQATAPAPTVADAVDPTELARLRAEHDELLKLRGEFGLLAGQYASATQHLARAAAPRRAMPAARPAPSSEVDIQVATQESLPVIQTMKQLGLAARIFANDNNMLYPTNFSQFAKESLPPTETLGTYEFVPHATVLNLNNPNLILLRETAPRAVSSGGFVRIYTLADGSVQTVTSMDGNFASFEQGRIVLPSDQASAPVQ
jgi:RNA polymerase sigma factor (sigma-70 family)